jgi:preprotein translocase subunit SecB
MPTKKTAGKPEAISYEEFVRGLRPVIVGLIQSSCKIDPALYWNLRRKQPRATHNLEAKYNVKGDEPDCFDIQADFRLAIKDPKKNTVALSIECTFETHFHMDGAIRREHAERFAQSEYRVIIFPFFRQFVFDTTSRMSIPPVIVPLTTT